MMKLPYTFAVSTRASIRAFSEADEGIMSFPWMSDQRLFSTKSYRRCLYMDLSAN